MDNQTSSSSSLTDQQKLKMEENHQKALIKKYNREDENDKLNLFKLINLEYFKNNIDVKLIKILRKVDNQFKPIKSERKQCVYTYLNHNVLNLEINVNNILTNIIYVGSGTESRITEHLSASKNTSSSCSKFIRKKNIEKVVLFKVFSDLIEELSLSLEHCLIYYLFIKEIEVANQELPEYFLKLDEDEKEYLINNIYNLVYLEFRTGRYMSFNVDLGDD